MAFLVSSISRIRPSLLSTVFLASVGAAVLIAACGDPSVVTTGSTGTNTGSSSGNGGSGGSGGSTGVFEGTGSAAGGAGGNTQQGFDIQPAGMQTITVALGQATPPITYQATLNGIPVNAGWGVDHGNVGKVVAGPAPSTTFTPTGTTGGPVNVIGGLNGQTLTRSIFVKLSGMQNGGDPGNPLEVSQIPTSVASLTQGGGIGGVGGEGLGPAVTDTATLTALATPTGDGSAQGLKLLYPYDKTVWPRGLLAPLLQWDWSLGDADAIRIELSTTTQSFSWVGTFAKPAILQQTNGKFIRHPIPEDVWQAATNTAGGADQLTVKLTVAKGGMAYGPLTETWTVAQGRLSGIIYYQSYGTQLAHNYGGAVGGNHKFGGAVLSIHGGDTGPVLAAGDDTQCRVCHSVAANGSRLVVQHGDNYNASSDYDLTPTSTTEHVIGPGPQFPAMFPDGSMALSPAGQILPLPTGTPPVTPTGLAAVTTNAGTPAFSPSGTSVAFNPIAGPLANPQQKLVVMGFDVASSTFTNPMTVVDDTGQAVGVRPGWPAFLPDGASLVFHAQTAAGSDGPGLGALATRKGAKAHIEWASTTAASTATPLNQLNGKDMNGNSYLPSLAQPINMTCTGDGVQVGGIDADHANDVDLNYEPTVNPVASGGYVWVVFTSRRMYGSVANIPPFCSDPRGVDLIQNITPKKLWVAAIDLNPQANVDTSHPAFYLPAQEILAGNSRGFWALDPCKSDGTSCDAGDECCNGYCEPDTMGNLVCQNTPPNGMCSMPQEKCTTAGDCCDATNLCVNGFCAQKSPG